MNSALIVALALALAAGGRVHSNRYFTLLTYFTSFIFIRVFERYYIPHFLLFQKSVIRNVNSSFSKKEIKNKLELIGGMKIENVKRIQKREEKTTINL